MTKAQPVGFWMNAAEAPEATLVDVARRSKARGHTVANGIATAEKVYQAAAAVIDEEPIVVVREDIGFDQNWKDSRYDPSKYADTVAARLGGRRHLPWQIWNEPFFASSAELAQGLARGVAIASEIAERGYKFSLGGWATASMWQQAVIDSGITDNYLHDIGELTNAGHGYEDDHAYVFGSMAHSGGGYCCLDMLDPNKAKRENWPTKKAMLEPGTPINAQGVIRPEDLDAVIAYDNAVRLLSPRANAMHRAAFVNETGQTPEAYLLTHAVAQDATANWLMMRDRWKDLRARARGFKLARRRYGEGTHDDLPNARMEGWAQKIEAALMGGQKLRGILDQIPLLGKLFPWAGGDDLALMENWEWWIETKADNVLSLAVFCLNFNEMWRTFNLLTRQTFWPVYYSFADRMSQAGGGTVAVPKPTNAGTGIRAKLRTTSLVRVRAAPALSGALVAEPTHGALLTYYKGGVVTADGYKWYWVELDGGKAGWQALVYEYEEEQWIAPTFVARTFRNPVNYPHVIPTGGHFNDPRNYSFAPTKLQKHEGVDFAGTAGQASQRPIVAPADGVVQRVTTDTYYGKYVRLSFGGGWRGYFAHMSAVSVTVGQTVKEGDVIGYEGATGNTNGPHCHCTLVCIGYGLPNYVVDDVLNPEPLIRAVTPPDSAELDALRQQVATLTQQKAELQTANGALTNANAVLSDAKLALEGENLQLKAQVNNFRLLIVAVKGALVAANVLQDNAVNALDGALEAGTVMPPPEPPS